jgi:SAM-dependent methyltransferase
MKSAASRNEAQIAFWNSVGGDRWVAAAEHTDRMMKPVQEALLARADLQPGMGVLEIGCGCGETAIEIARRVSNSGRVLGVDVSPQMLALARTLLASFPQAEFLEADAGAHPFEQFADLAISRFGVMFFGDPVAAFANIRKAIKPGGRLLFAVWRAVQDNEWTRVPLEAALSAGVPAELPLAPEEPGPFSFAEPERIRRILTAAGFSEPAFSPICPVLDFAAGGGLEAAVRQAMTIGAAAALLRKQPQDLIAAARAKIETALRPYERGGTVALSAAIWLVEARPA